MTSSISWICQFSLSKVFIGIGLRVCIHKGECVYVYTSICICTLFRKTMYLHGACGFKMEHMVWYIEATVYI